MKKKHDHPLFKPRRPTAILTPKKPRFSSGTVLSLAAVVISIAAASISFWQLDLMREHNRLSVRPYLMVTPHLTAEKAGLYLSNEGIGPGIITSFKIRVGGEQFDGLGDSRWPAVLKKARLKPECFSKGWPTEGAAVRPGNEIAILSPTKSTLFGGYCLFQLSLFLQENEVFADMEYESLYKERFTFSAPVTINEAMDIGALSKLLSD
ncbi:hypothetical protein [Pseudomonas shahriarae]|uniref:hypothetical protein n=1 Tax=Pseudomonas shahriarae TaxID=2745512 RepID=UPI000E087183|nr:hypothetical protein [Pseudomonas shahriarae]MDD0980435.1 hypothetical protein [Pseudomonas shahriarae]SUD45628.1 Uncharacterised protein [Pseudomonas fluorescens]